MRGGGGGGRGWLGERVRVVVAVGVRDGRGARRRGGEEVGAWVGDRWLRGWVGWGGVGRGGGGVELRGWGWVGGVGEGVRWGGRRRRWCEWWCGAGWGLVLCY